MAVKAVNDTAGPNGLVSTLLVFGSYPRIPSDQPAVTPDVKQRVMAIQKAMKEVRVIMDRRKVADALSMRNGPNTLETAKLQPGDEVLVWRESGKWTGPYNLLCVSDDTCTVELQHGPTAFRITSVKPYHPGRGNKEERSCGAEAPSETGRNSEVGPSTSTTTTAKLGRGRPKGSKDKPKLLQNDNFLSTKEIHDLELAKQLRRTGKITTPGEPFEASDRKEIDALIAGGIFRFEQHDPLRHTDRIFNSRMVREIKNKNTKSPYEKSRLVVRGFNDEGKSVILTQSPTIQRASQRIILALAPTLKERGIRTGDDIAMTQKGQGKRIQLVTNDDTKSYVEQRARGAYLATICQPEATFDLSVAAQTREPSVMVPADNEFARDHRIGIVPERGRAVRLVPYAINADLFYYVLFSGVRGSGSLR
ncbi:hypothetical protein K3495_g10881 [Podosphaera aphanis]|nr:hypothetical protein K3495_g10881 [Podosphaera aphanis]